MSSPKAPSSPPFGPGKKAKGKAGKQAQQAQYEAVKDHPSLQVEPNPFEPLGERQCGTGRQLMRAQKRLLRKIKAVSPTLATAMHRRRLSAALYNGVLLPEVCISSLPW